METVSTLYTEMMESLIRPPTRLGITFKYPTGDVVYTNKDIVKLTEKKSAHLIAGELPSLDVSIELINLDGKLNPNNASGYHDMIVAGVEVVYTWYYDEPVLNYYGYDESGVWHDYGMKENVPYGFKGATTEKSFSGGQVFTSGAITYSPTTATITAKDFLSFLDETSIISYGSRALSDVAWDIINLTNYPETELGVKKLIIGNELEDFTTGIMASTTDNELSAKEHLQTIAHACGVQMYIDRDGYLHLDNDQRVASVVYTLPLESQAENPNHSKEQMPKKLTIPVYNESVEVDLKGGGESMEVENPFIVTTAQGESLRDTIIDHFIAYRNLAEITYRGEPALDILDHITLSTKFPDDPTVEAIVVGSTLNFDGTINGTLTLRYSLGETSTIVKISGGGNFIYPLGVTDVPSTTSYDLLCTTNIATPTYQWSYYSVYSGAWLSISGATTNELAVAYNSTYFTNDSSVIFKCVVNDERGGVTKISKIQLQKSSTSSYRGTVTPTERDNLPSPETGDVILVDNTSDETAEVYGKAEIYNGEEWVETESSDDLSLCQKDALVLAKKSNKIIYVATIFVDNLFANEVTVYGSISVDHSFVQKGVFRSDRFYPERFF